MVFYYGHNGRSHDTCQYLLMGNNLVDKPKAINQPFFSGISASGRHETYRDLIKKREDYFLIDILTR